MTKEEIAKRFCKFELCTHRNGEGTCCLYNQDNCIFHRLEKENAELKAVERMALYSKLSDQLAQAKEIIKNLISSKTDFDERRFVLWAWKEEVEQAEQFLKEIEK